jgi:hypothetical protein
MSRNTIAARVRTLAEGVFLEVVFFGDVASPHDDAPNDSAPTNSQVNLRITPSPLQSPGWFS